MRIMIVSDIHGSAYYCEKMIKAYKLEGADKIIILGDILYHGPRNDLPLDYNPKKVIEKLNEIKNEILCVRGNCDTEVDQMVLDFPILAEYAIVDFDNHIGFITHGHVFNKQNMPKIKPGEILINGHTHIPAFERYNEYIYINPGSISIPKGDSENSYIMYEKGKFEFKNLEGKTYRTEIL